MKVNNRAEAGGSQVDDIERRLERAVMAAQEDTMRSPRQRWGTCCPFDPECEHSFMDDAALTKWMDMPISDEAAAKVADEFADDGTAEAMAEYRSQTMPSAFNA